VCFHGADGYFGFGVCVKALVWACGLQVDVGIGCVCCNVDNTFLVEHDVSVILFGVGASEEDDCFGVILFEV
jgi:hypothetical protein